MNVYVVEKLVADRLAEARAERHRMLDRAVRARGARRDRADWARRSSGSDSGSRAATRRWREHRRAHAAR